MVEVDWTVRVPRQHIDVPGQGEQAPQGPVQGTGPRPGLLGGRLQVGTPHPGRGTACPR